MYSWVKIVGLVLVGLVAGYVVGVYQWRGMAVIESYAIGYDQGYASGISDGSIPGAEVIGVHNGKITSRRKNPE